MAGGRDIVRFADTAEAKGGALIMSDPDYDLGWKYKEKVKEELRAGKRIRGTVSRDAGGLSFERLPDTAQEAEAVAGTLKNKYTVKTYSQRKALEEVLFSEETPRVLHIATHGYFLSDQEGKADTGQGFSDSRMG